MDSQTTKVFTIGATGSSAQDFFERLRQADVRKVIDTRLWAGSQLAGFTKKKDLPYFLQEIGGIAYEYRKDMAPSDDILKPFKNGEISWEEYEVRYNALIRQRSIANVVQIGQVHQACFLCACKTHHHCHRRLLVEHLQNEWPESLEVTHL